MPCHGFSKKSVRRQNSIHPNIVTAYDAGEHEGSPFLVMELIEGRDLFRHVQEHGPLPWNKAVDYILQAARGPGIRSRPRGSFIETSSPPTCSWASMAR